MGKILDSTNVVRTLLREFVTADNTEQIAKMTKALDDVDSVANTMETENITLKDKLVDIVKSGIVTKEEPKSIEPEEKSLDEIMIEEAQKIISK